MKIKLVLMLALLGGTVCCHAQRFSVSTNLLDYVALGTLNADFSYAFSRHWSTMFGIRYNPFTYGDGQGQFQNRQQSYSLGIRMWPWHIMSGWWFGSKIRYQEYNVGGIISPQTREGDRYGVGLYSGYTHMISHRFNLEFGLGLWGGWDRYTRYNCPRCGIEIDEGSRVFVLPDDWIVSLVYVF